MYLNEKITNDALWKADTIFLCVFGKLFLVCLEQDKTSSRLVGIHCAITILVVYTVGSVLTTTWNSEGGKQ